MVADAVLVALISESLTSGDVARRAAAESLLMALRAGQQPAEIQALVGAADGAHGVELRELAHRLGLGGTGLPQSLSSSQQRFRPPLQRR
jgi:hypothetical protein